jgi:MFS family permease
MSSSRPYSSFRWVILVMLMLSSISSSMIMISFAPLMGVIKDDLGISAGTASLGFMGLHALMTAVACAICGVLIDKLGIFRVLLAAMVILIVSNSALPLIGHGYWPLVFIRAIEAFGCAAPVVAIGPICATWFPRNEVGIANGAQSVAMSVGMMMGLTVAPILARVCGTWQNGVAWLSVGNVIAFVIIFAVSLVAKKYQAMPVETEIENFPVAAEASLGKYVGTRPFIVGILCMICGLWVQNAFNDLTPGYLAIPHPVGVGFGAVAAGKLMSTVLTAGIIGSVLGGILMDRVFGGRSKPVVLLGFALIAVNLVLLMQPQVYDNRPLLILCLMLTGMGTPFINPIVLAFGAETFPAAVVGKVIGVWMSAAVFSQAAGVMIGAVALKATGNYHLSMVIVSAVAVIGFLITLFLPKNSKTQEEEKKVASESLLP